MSKEAGMDAVRKRALEHRIERAALTAIEAEFYGQPALEAIDDLSLADLAPFRAAVRMLLDRFDSNYKARS
jgi:hypothetical protein